MAKEILLYTYYYDIFSIVQICYCYGNCTKGEPVFMVALIKRTIRKMLKRFGMTIINEKDNLGKFLHPSQIIETSGCYAEDIELLSKYVDNDAAPYPGYYTDFMGIRTSPGAFTPGFLDSAAGQITRNIPIPDDSFHAMAIEYCSLLSVVEATNTTTFTMFELGAGWGPWMSYAVKACRMKGGFSHINTIGVEGEENKIPLIEDHLAVNGFREDNGNLTQTYNGVHSRIIHGIVGEKDGLIDFPVASADNYGVSVLYTKPGLENKMVSVPCYSLETLMKDFETVDFMHIDIQGYEWDVITSSIKSICEKVRYMCISTHSRKIEGDLIDFLLKNGWELHRESPCAFRRGDNKPIHIVDLTTHDGNQFWKNTAT